MRAATPPSYALCATGDKHDWLPIGCFSPALTPGFLGKTSQQRHATRSIRMEFSMEMSGTAKVRVTGPAGLFVVRREDGHQLSLNSTDNGLIEWKTRVAAKVFQSAPRDDLRGDCDRYKEHGHNNLLHHFRQPANFRAAMFWKTSPSQHKRTSLCVFQHSAKLSLQGRHLGFAES